VRKPSKKSEGIFNDFATDYHPSGNLHRRQQSRRIDLSTHDRFGISTRQSGISEMSGSWTTSFISQVIFMERMITWNLKQNTEIKVSIMKVIQMINI